MSLQEDLAWLRATNTVLWERPPERSLTPIETKARRTYPAAIRLTTEDTTRAFDLISRWSLPVNLCNTSFGFGVGLQVWEPELPALYPGVTQEPERLLVFSQEHLPLSEAKKMSDRIMFDDGWRVFSPLVYRQENLLLLERCGLPAPREKSHYVY